MASMIQEGEISYSRASASLDRNARPAKKAELYLVSGMLDLFRKKPQSALRKFETSLALYKKLFQPLRMLECLHGIKAILQILGVMNRIARVESQKRDLVSSVSEMLLCPDKKRSFHAYHNRGGSFNRCMKLKMIRINPLENNADQ